MNAFTNELKKLAVVYRDIDDLKPSERNPRSHSKKRIKQIARSIQKFGFIGYSEPAP